ncbi:MAG: hypothetical protein HZB09_02245 [Candidatus Yonathbacteria bacterium]|nr:hypothetical protein [Candidatus Yonathbacteria bacterium]
MKILVIDNGTSYLNQLKNLLSDTSFEVINYSEINRANSENFDAIILSGGHDFPVNGNGHRLEKKWVSLKIPINQFLEFVLALS